MTRVAIVGAGIIGACIAYRLAKAGAAVTLIDRDGPGAGASGKSFAWINANAPEPGFYNRFRQGAIAAWRRMETEVTLPIRWGGCLSWEFGGNALRAQAEALAAATGKPLITSNQAQFWSCLRRAGIADEIRGFGRIFSCPGDALETAA